MKINLILCTIAVILSAVIGVSAQKTRKVPPSPRSLIFAVVDDGTRLEPIAFVNKGKLSEPVSGGDAGNLITAFNRTYYKPGSSYRLIFGSAESGTVKVKSSDAGGDCGKNLGTVSVTGAKTPLKGLVMGLATDMRPKVSAPVRRRPTTSEKDEIEQLVTAEYQRQKLTPNALRYQNLTALDFNGDGKNEFVGSYWVEVDKETRALLFFIAGRDSNGKLNIGYKEYRSVDQGSIMSGADMKAVDDGVLHEVLVDVFDYDGDGDSEVFTSMQGFEGVGYTVYKRSGSKWVKSYEFSNYRCAF